ncbi:hypothetical protein GCM10022381_28150 [Leifsonia kafniensis]|uniref:FAD-binding domain-containing protein n=1 Tax=Leifsonia kafniensis TaxID=475957 RepID=A0ABP7KQ02_9MICO
MTSDAHLPVLIIGGGPVGILNALGLARAGVPVHLFERSDAVVQSPRAVVYHWSVLDGLDRLGLFEEASTRGFLKQDYAYRVFKTGQEVRYGLQALEGKVTHPFNLHMGQNVLAELALERLMAYPHAQVHWSHTFVGVTQDADSVTAEFETVAGPVTFTGSWLIGADGAGSAVRKSQNIDFEGITWPERFVATNVRYPFEKNGWGQTTFLVDDEYGAIITKIDNSGAHGLWRVTYAEDAALPVDGIEERMPAYFAAILADPENVVVEAYSPYSMHQRAAAQFRSGRVLLAGDAAHSTNPTGGLGLTSGLFDTFVLYEALAAVIAGTAEEAVLDVYATERHRIFTEIVTPAASNNKRLVYHSSDPVRLAEDLAEIEKLPIDEEALVKRLMFPKSLETPSLIGAW